jgi:hypothetical protein
MSGFITPRPGDGGPFICCKCGNHFNHHGGRNRFGEERGLFDLIRDLTGCDFVRCPKRGSFRTDRDPRLVY